VTNDKLPSLTGLRFVAAMAVVISHLLGMMVKVEQPTPFLHAFLQVMGTMSGAGMTLFFVLSGFVIHMNYSGSISTPTGLWNFFAARFARLYPLYFVFLCFDLSMRLGFHQFKVERLEALPFYLTLTQTWVYWPIDGNALVYQFGLVPAVSWSISTEWFFYLCFPLLCLCIAPLRHPRRILSAMFTLCLIAFVIVTVINLNAGAVESYGVNRYGAIAGSVQDGYFRWLAYFTPYVRVLEFALGCLTSVLVRSLAPPTQRERHLGSYLLLGVIVGAAVLQWIMFGRASTPGFITGLHMNFGFAPFVAATIFCCARYDTPIVRWLSSAPIVLAGEASYSIYLSHLLVINAFRYEVPTVADPQIWAAVIPQVAITLAAIVGISLVLWFLIEMPARRAIRRWLTISNRAPSKVPVAVPG
jgi:peptidoglycan/LPS O-acetylase OafA/YrhL